jgi:hypothetical protein
LKTSGTNGSGGGALPVPRLGTLALVVIVNRFARCKRVC